MNFEADDDLASFLNFVGRIAEPFKAPAALGRDRFSYSDELDGQLQRSGYFSAVTEPGLGPVAAVAMVHELAQLPVCAEIAASALVQPVICPDLPRPLAVIWGSRERPARFLPMARSVISVQGDAVMSASLDPDQVRVVDSLFAYPMGVLRDPHSLTWKTVESASVAGLERLWRLGVAAEITGNLQGALTSVTAYVTQRRQFGRPIGSFQGVQHRLAHAASQVEGARWLTLKAAWSGSDDDAATALGMTQALSTRVVYDLHQFMGAMGLTLEHPLHRWTYRVRLLRSELGGADSNLEALANMTWNPQQAQREARSHVS